MNAVVAGLPKSWHTAPSMTAICCGAVEIVDARARLVDRPAACAPRRRPPDATRAPAGSRPAPAARETAARRRRAPAPARSRSTAAARRAASRSRPRCARPADRRAESCRQMSRRLVVSARSKRAANWTARSTRRLSSAKRRRIDDAQDAALEIAAAVERIEVVVGQRIPGDRVDREVAPPRGLLDASSTDRR